MISILVFCLIPDPRGPPCLADALLHYSCRRAVAKLAHFLFLGVFNGSIALIQQVTEPTVGPAGYLFSRFLAPQKVRRDDALQRKIRLKQAPVARWRDVKSNSAQRATRYVHCLCHRQRLIGNWDPSNEQSHLI